MGLDVRKPVFGVCKQQRRRPACASPQSDQHLCYWLNLKYHIKTFKSEISIFNLVSVAEETGLNFALTENPKTGFCRDEAHIVLKAQGKFRHLAPI